MYSTKYVFVRRKFGFVFVCLFFSFSFSKGPVATTVQVKSYHCSVRGCVPLVFALLKSTLGTILS